MKGMYGLQESQQSHTEGLLPLPFIDQLLDRFAKNNTIVS